MIPSKLNRPLLGLLLLATPFSTHAITKWQIVSNESEVSFTAIQNDAPVSGKFTRFNGDINFDPEQLATSQVFVSIDTGSVSTSYQQIADTLKTEDWLNTNLFPKATFQSNKITQVGNNNYQAEGTLTIRDKSLPVKINFQLDNNSQNKSQAKGKATIKRNSFGVGQGEWSSTDEVKDDVTVNFNLSLEAKNS